MINLIIYLDQLKDSKDLVALLLKERLIANASIDQDNVCYRIKDDHIQKTINSVITAQTRSMLFSDIVRLIHDQYGEQVPIYSMPITQANHSFDQLIRETSTPV